MSQASSATLRLERSFEVHLAGPGGSGAHDDIDPRPDGEGAWGMWGLGGLDLPIKAYLRGFRQEGKLPPTVLWLRVSTLLLSGTQITRAGTQVVSRPGANRGCSISFLALPSHIQYPISFTLFF